MLALAALPLVAAAPAQAQAVSTLVSNIDQSQTGTWQLSTHDMAVKFTTGSHQAGYALSDIEIRFHAIPTSLSVKLASSLPTAGSTPSTTVPLDNPATLTNAVNKFTAPAGTTLAAGTDYWIVLEGSAGGPRGTASDTEDAGAEAGWSVGNTTRWRAHDSTGSWTSATNALMIRVNGSAAVSSSVSDVEIVSTPRLPESGTKTTYGAGQAIVVAVTWDTPVTWDVSATNAGIGVNLDIGGTTKRAELVTDGATSGTAQTLWFSYTVASADSDSDGVAVTPDGDGKLVLLRNGATLAGVSGSATVNHAGLVAQSGHLVNGGSNAPDSTDASLTAATIDGDILTLTFSESLLPVLDDTNEDYGIVELLGSRNSALDRLYYSFDVKGLYRDGVRLRDVIVTHGRVSVDGKTVTLAMSNARAHPGIGGMTVRYDAHMAGLFGVALRDPNGGVLPTVTHTVTNNTGGVRRPLLASAQVAGTKLTLTFDRALDEMSKPLGNRFEVRHTPRDWYGEWGSVKGTRDQVTVNGQTVTITLAGNVPQDRMALVSYRKPSANPLRGAASPKPEVDGFGLLQTMSLDADPPVLSDALLVGTTLTLYYGDTLDTNSVPAIGTMGAFSVAAGGNAQLVCGVAVHHDAVKLTVKKPAQNSVSCDDGTTPDQDVTVTYTVPTANPVQDVAGNDAASLSNYAVSRDTTDPSVHPSLERASAAGAVVSLDFSQRLDPAHVPTASAFEFSYVTYDGETAPENLWNVTGVTVNGTTVELAVSPGWYPCVRSATVTYTKPAADWLRNLWGLEPTYTDTDNDGTADNVEAQIVNTRSRNVCTYIGPVISMGPMGGSGDDPPQSGSGNPQGMGRRQMSLQFDRQLSTRSVPDRKSFSVTPDRGADPVEVEEARLSDDASVIVLALSRSLGGGEGVTVNYRRPFGSPGLWTADGDQIADFSGEVVVPEPNQAPMFDGAAPGTVNAPPGTLVSLPVSKDDFVDPDGDQLTFTLSASRDDVYVAGGLGYSDVVDRVFFNAKTACALIALDPLLLELHDTVVTMTATDPDGEAAHVHMTFRTDRRGFVCPSLSSATVNGAELLMTFDAAFERRHRWLPTASDFEVSVDGGAVDLAADAVSVSGDTITLTLTEPVTASEFVTVSYSSVDTPIAVAFADEPAANHSPAPHNQAPVFGGRAPGWVNAPPGVLVSLPVSKADFADPDGDPLMFTLSASRDDTYVAGDLVYSDVVDRVFFVAKTACGLAGVNPPLTGVVDTVVTMTATDPDGATAQVAMTFRTDPESYPCPSLSGATVDGATLAIELDADMAPSYRRVPTASDFDVQVDGVTVSLAADGRSASGNTITLTLAESVTADQSVTVSYTPGDFPVAAAFTNAPAANNTPPADPPAGDAPAGLEDAVLAGVSVNGNELTLTFHQDLTALDQVAARSLRFAFLVQGAYRHGVLISNQSPNQVVIDGATVTLTLGVGIPAGHEVTVSYSAAAAGNILRYSDGTAISDFDSTLTTTQQG